MSQQLPLWVVILVALGIPTLLVAMVGAGFKTWQAYQQYKRDRAAKAADRVDQREDRAEQRDERREDRTETWNDQVRTNIEKHIPWDARVLAHVQRLELLVNDLREGQGKTPVVFPPIGSPPDLFPAGKAPPRDDAA